MTDEQLSKGGGMFLGLLAWAGIIGISVLVMNEVNPGVGVGVAVVLTAAFFIVVGRGR